jgi:hypothetical protein
VCIEYVLAIMNYQPPSSSPPPAPSQATIGPRLEVCDISLYFQASGYVEGYASTTSFGIAVASIDGTEVVYDFATLERVTYKFEDAPLADPKNVPYLPGVGIPECVITKMTKYVDLNAFDSWKSLDQE